MKQLLLLPMLQPNNTVKPVLVNVHSILSIAESNRYKNYSSVEMIGQGGSFMAFVAVPFSSLVSQLSELVVAVRTSPEMRDNPPELIDGVPPLDSER